MLDAGQHKKKNGIYRRGKLTCKESKETQEQKLISLTIQMRKE